MGSYKKIEYIIFNDNNEEMVWCNMEKIHKPSTEFDLSNDSKHGYMTMCKDCRLVYRRKHKEFGNLNRDEEELQSKRVLKCLGYDFNSEFTIHEQFIMKYNEELNRPKVVKKRKKRK